MSLAALEDEIVALLSPLEDDGLSILNSPAKTQNARPIARALVYFSGSSSDALKGITVPFYQTETLSFSVQLELIDLRSHRPAYVFLEEIRNKLAGYRPTFGRYGTLYHISTDYVALEDGSKWLYSASFGLESLRK